MRRIHNHWKMRFGFQDWNSAQIERVAGGSLKCSNAALAENDVRVALVQNVFGAHDQIVNCGAESALEQHGKSATAHFLQKRKIVHVARAHLKTVCVLLD